MKKLLLILLIGWTSICLADRYHHGHHGHHGYHGGSVSFGINIQDDSDRYYRPYERDYYDVYTTDDSDDYDNYEDSGLLRDRH